MTTYTHDLADLRRPRTLTYVEDPDGMGQELDRLMELDCRAILVTINRDGRVTVETDRPDAPPAPDLHALADDEGQHTADTDPDLHRQARAQGWELETGWTGQYSYHGPCMHPSEYVGGALAQHVLTYGSDVWDRRDDRLPGRCPATRDSRHVSGEPGEPCAACGLEDDPKYVAAWWVTVEVIEEDGEARSWAIAHRIVDMKTCTGCGGPIIAGEDCPNYGSGEQHAVNPANTERNQS